MSTPDVAERTRGYQRWKGEKTAAPWRWWVIARANLSLAWANRWVKVVLISSLIPGIILAGITYFFLPLSAVVLDIVLDATLLWAFLVGATVGARLISEDRRQGAFLAHFARPVRRVDYIVGKMLALAIPIFLVTTASPLLAIAADTAVDSETVADRLREEFGDVPDEGGYLRHVNTGAVVGAVSWFGLIASLGTAGIVLGLSALTTRARIAGVIWFAVVAFGAAAHGILASSLGKDWPALLSWNDTLRDISSHLLGLPHDPVMGQVLEFDLGTRVGVLLLASAVGILVVHEQLRRAEGGAR